MSEIDERTEKLQAAINKVIAQQVADEEPIETKQALARLAKQGFTRDQAMNLVGTIVVAQVFDVLAKGEPYNHQNYIDALNKLPDA